MICRLCQKCISFSAQTYIYFNHLHCLYLIHWIKSSSAVHIALQCLLTTGCTKTDLSAVVHWLRQCTHKLTHACTQTHTLFGHSFLSLNKYRSPSIRGDKDAIGNFHRSAVTKQLLDEWLRKGREELTHSSCDVKDVKGHTHKHTLSLYGLAHIKTRAYTYAAGREGCNLPCFR